MGYAWGTGDFVPAAAAHNQQMLQQEASMAIQSLQQQGERYRNGVERQTARAQSAEREFTSKRSQLDQQISQLESEIRNLQDQLRSGAASSSQGSKAREIQRVDERIDRLRNLITRMRNHLAS